MFSVPGEISATLEALNEHYAEFTCNDRGANGYLWFARNRISLAEVAIKFYAGESGDRRHDEPRLLSTISSPNVLPILDARNVSNDWAYFITPKCDGGDLDDFIKTQPSVYAAIDVVLGICNGVSALHARGLVHRDLKPGNIVMDRGIPRIADFGSVRSLSRGKDLPETSASQHSILYRPPESYSTNRYSRLGDVYQVGLVTYQSFGGSLPYDGTRYLTPRERTNYEKIDDCVDRSIFVDNALRQRAEAGTLLDLTTLPPWISTAAKRTIRLMTNPAPSKRLGSIADASASMSQLRTTLGNWGFVGAAARLEKEGRVIEVRPAGSSLYEVFQQRSGTFRRMPGWQPSTLSDLVTRCSVR